jgi:hypothetical protein
VPNMEHCSWTRIVSIMKKSVWEAIVMPEG